MAALGAPRRRGDGGGRGAGRFAAQRRGRGRGGLAAGEASARLLLGLSLETGFLRAAQFFLALARFGGFALGLFARLALATRLGLRLLAAAVFFFARAGVDERPCARLALLFGQRAQHHAGLRRRDRRGDGAVRAGAARRERAPWAPARRRRRLARRRASPGPRTRRLTFSTTTALLRPCEKLCRTVPCSTGRFRCKVAFAGDAPKVLSPLLFVSLMRFSSNPGLSIVHSGDCRSRRSGSRRRARRRRRAARPISRQTRDLGEKGRARLARVERCMYHICPPQCQIQLARGEEIYSCATASAASPRRPRSRRSSFDAPSGAPSAAWISADDRARRGSPPRPSPRPPPRARPC